MREYVAEPCTTDLYYLGESCRWDEVRGELYWVDLYAGRLFRATADATRVEIIASYEVDGSLTAVAPMRDRGEGWIVATDQAIAILSERGQLRELDAPEAARTTQVRMNDGVADPWVAFGLDRCPTMENPVSATCSVTPKQPALKPWCEVSPSPMDSVGVQIGKRCTSSIADPPASTHSMSTRTVKRAIDAPSFNWIPIVTACLTVCASTPKVRYGLRYGEALKCGVTLQLAS